MDLSEKEKENHTLITSQLPVLDLNATYSAGRGGRAILDLGVQKCASFFYPLQNKKNHLN